MGTVKEIFETLKNNSILIQDQKYYDIEDTIKQEMDHFDVLEPLWGRGDYFLNRVVYQIGDKNLEYIQIMDDDLEVMIYFRVTDEVRALTKDEIVDLAEKFIEYETRRKYQ